jgi:hypothetical protein
MDGKMDVAKQIPSSEAITHSGFTKRATVACFNVIISSVGYGLKRNFYGITGMLDSAARTFFLRNLKFLEL